MHEVKHSRVHSRVLRFHNHSELVTHRFPVKYAFGDVCTTSAPGPKCDSAACKWVEYGVKSLFLGIGYETRSGWQAGGRNDRSCDCDGSCMRSRSPTHGIDCRLERWVTLPHGFVNSPSRKRPFVMSHLSGKFFQVSVPIPHVYLVQANRAPVNAFNER